MAPLIMTGRAAKKRLYRMSVDRRGSSPKLCTKWLYYDPESMKISSIHLHCTVQAVIEASSGSRTCLLAVFKVYQQQQQRCISYYFMAFPLARCWQATACSSRLCSYGKRWVVAYGGGEGLASSTA